MVESNPEVVVQEVEVIEDPATHLKILELLKSHSIEFKVTEHAPVKTSQEAADIRGVALASGAKAMLIADAGKKLALPEVKWYLVVMAANRRLNSKVLKQLICTKRTNFASPEDVLRVTGCIPGAVPPFGSLFSDEGRKVPTFVDESLASNLMLKLCVRNPQLKLMYSFAARDSSTNVGTFFPSSLKRLPNGGTAPGMQPVTRSTSSGEAKFVRLVPINCFSTLEFNLLFAAITTRYHLTSGNASFFPASAMSIALAPEARATPLMSAASWEVLTGACSVTLNSMEWDLRSSRILR